MSNYRVDSKTGALIYNNKTTYSTLKLEKKIKKLTSDNEQLKAELDKQSSFNTEIMKRLESIEERG